MEITFFCLYQKDKSSESNVKFRQASIRCKRVLEAAKLTYPNKTKESIFSQKHDCPNFWQIANSVLNQAKSAISPLSNGPKCCLLYLINQNCFAENFSKNSNLDDSGISL